MIFGRDSFAGEGTAVITGLVLASLLFVAGCSDTTFAGYDANLAYELRSDPLILQTPTQDPTEPPKPGKALDFLGNLQQIGGRTLNPKVLTPDQQTTLRDVLESNFGKPAAPKVANVSAELESVLHLDEASLARGSASYSVRCAQCHGINGDGRGPTGTFIYPYPRDFRSGHFKRISNDAENGKPRFEDIRQALRRGVPGTSMLVLDLLPDAEIDELAAYVVHLSIRGEVELRTMKELLIDEDIGTSGIAASVNANLVTVLQHWQSAQRPAVDFSRFQFGPVDTQSPEGQESLRRGLELFSSQGCISCHSRYGKDDIYRYDIWGLPNRIRNLTEPEYRWGAEPEEILHRIRYGIRPANMPANPLMTDEQAQDLLNFIRELPYPARLPDDVRRKVDQ